MEMATAIFVGATYSSGSDHIARVFFGGPQETVDPSSAAFANQVARNNAVSIVTSCRSSCLRRCRSMEPVAMFRVRSTRQLPAAISMPMGSMTLR